MTLLAISPDLPPAEPAAAAAVDGPVRAVLQDNARLRAVFALLEDVCGAGADRAEIMRRATKCVRELMSAEFAAVALPVEDELEYAALEGEPAPVTPIRLHRHASLTGWCLENGMPVLCGDIEADPRGSVVARRVLGVRSLLNAPLLAKDTAIGVLSALSTRPHAFTEADGRILDMIAAVLSMAITNAIAHREKELLLAERGAALEQLRASEELHRALTEHSDELINIVDLDGVIRFVGPAVTRLLGWTAVELQGTRASHHVHPDDRQLMIDTYRQLLGEPSRSRQMTVRLRHRDGSWRCFEGHGRNLLHVPAVRGITSNARDVTEQRALEEQLRQAQKMEAVGQLAGGVAHDFNNVLTAIASYADLLAEQLTDVGQREDAIEIRKAAWRGADLTKKLLAFSRKQTMRVEVLDASDVLRGIEKMLRHVIPDDVALTSEYGTGPLPVEIDRTQLEQVLMNLLINARDAMPDGGRIRVALSRQPGQSDAGEASGLCIIRVTDTGTGMTEETKSHLFEPFFTTKGEGKGTGLGLSVVYGIIRQLKGSIAVQSRLGHGTAFTISLPLSALPPELSDTRC